MRRALLLAIMFSSLTVLAMTDTVPDDDPPDCGRSKPFPDCNYDRQAFPPRIHPPAAGWFELSTNYPGAVESEPQPWKAYDPFQQDDPRERWRQSNAYMQSVLAYSLDGNIQGQGSDADFVVDKNRWFNAPWLHYGCKGREAIHGLTLERRSRAGELAIGSPDSDNWAIGFYNRPGGYFMGQVWSEYASPDFPDLERMAADPVLSQGFPDGTVGFKLLFSQPRRTSDPVPYLERSPVWDAMVFPYPFDRSGYPCNEDDFQVRSRSVTPNPSDMSTYIRRVQGTVTLLQVDIAVKDARSPTQWVFGTFIYDASRAGEQGWDQIEKRLTPVGLAWGNDPGVTQIAGVDDRTGPVLDCDLDRSPGLTRYPTCARVNTALRETSLNEGVLWQPGIPYDADQRAYVRTLGLGSRLNGPVDNPGSSCLSCHGHSGVERSFEEPQMPFRSLPGGDRESRFTRLDYRFASSGEDPALAALFGQYFANTPPGVTRVEASRTRCGDDEQPRMVTRLDYSLQLQVGLQNFVKARRGAASCKFPPAIPAPLSGWPEFQVVKGEFVILNRSPDGDTVTFRPYDLSPFFNFDTDRRFDADALDVTTHLTTIRLEGMDTPELHLQTSLAEADGGSIRQRFAEAPRDALLTLLGFDRSQVRINDRLFVDDVHGQVIQGAVLTNRATRAAASMRAVAYVLAREEADRLQDGAWITIDEALLKQTVNYRMVQGGWAYPSSYRPTPIEHHHVFRIAADDARSRRLGVWDLDQSACFSIDRLLAQSETDQDSQLVHPAIFRKAAKYLEATSGITSARPDVIAWLKASARADGDAYEDDVVTLGDDPKNVPLSDLVVSGQSCGGDLGVDPSQFAQVVFQPGQGLVRLKRTDGGAVSN